MPTESLLTCHQAFGCLFLISIRNDLLGYSELSRRKSSVGQSPETLSLTLVPFFDFRCGKFEDPRRS